MSRFPYLALALIVAGPAFAQDQMAAPQGDASAGETIFNRQCVACHVVQNEAGETLAGRNAHVGPNLYGVVGRTLGTYPDFKYGDSMKAAGEAGYTWTEENFVGYVQDPTGWLKATLDDKRARGKMMFQLKSEDDAHNVYAYLASIGPEQTDAPAAAPSN